MSTEQDSVQRLAEIRLELSKYGELPSEEVSYLLSLIDSLTAERDRQQEYADEYALDASAAEVEVKRLRKALVVCFDAFDQRYDGAPDSRAQWMVEPMEAAHAALATPPSEGGQS